jgi:DNA uptake protein ComE-like DNA-binding protein
VLVDLPSSARAALSPRVKAGAVLVLVELGCAALVNINTAYEATLDTLPRVGPAMAARII